jgi:hypothetical protein
MVPFAYTFLILYPFVWGHGLFKKRKYVLCLDVISMTGTTNPFYKSDKYKFDVISYHHENPKENVSSVIKPHDIFNSFQNCVFKSKDQSVQDVLIDLKVYIEHFKKKHKYDEMHVFYYTNLFSDVIESTLSKGRQIILHNISNIYGQNHRNQKFVYQSRQHKSTDSNTTMDDPTDTSATDHHNCCYNLLTSMS